MATIKNPRLRPEPQPLTEPKFFITTNPHSRPPAEASTSDHVRQRLAAKLETYRTLVRTKAATNTLAPEQIDELVEIQTVLKLPVAMFDSHVDIMRDVLQREAGAPSEQERRRIAEDSEAEMVRLTAEIKQADKRKRQLEGEYNSVRSVFTQNNQLAAQIRQRKDESPLLFHDPLEVITRRERKAGETIRNPTFAELHANQAGA